MKCYISVVCVLSALLAVTLAAPATPEGSEVTLHTQLLDNIIQNVTSQVFRIVGGALLRSGGLGGGGSGGAATPGRVSVVLPTFPPDEDEDEDEEEESESETLNIASNINATANALNVNVNEISVDNKMVSKTTESSTSGATVTTTGAANPPPFTSASVSSDSNTVKRQIRRRREADASEDQEVAASGGNGPDPADDLANVEADDADRNKRYSPFGGDATGGSGNFLFDLIRNTADRAARTVGTVYRMVAGTENLGFGISATSTQSKTVAAAPQLVAGSGATEAVDEKEAGIGGIAELDVAPKGGNGEGIPGPITRLLVIANRGIANLIQDLILRLAQTSERIVNFKARLVTALI